MITIWQWQGSLRKLAISLLLLIAWPYAAAVPLPGQTMAQVKGLDAGMGFGLVKHKGCKALWTWTSQANYSYDSLLSGGPSLKFLGGNLDSTNNIVYQRYSASGKIMYNRSRYALFIGPVLSFENTNLSTLRREFSTIGENREHENATECGDLFAKIGSSIGYHSGGGFLATPSMGFSFGHNLDLTLDGAIIVSFSSSIAFNLREQFEKLRENTKNLWLSLEYSIMPRRNKNDIHNFILGLAVGF
ncbi:MAG: hypothetical protein LBQ87_05020 [Candidatus Fibromonas sp.]|jgi:hypothetical protein|nr:hypothetical protein [Candidatus Fibromonas sp.]